MRIGLLELTLHLPGVRSLKEKRGIVKGLLARVRQRFEVSAAEVAYQDQWQSVGLGVALVGNEVGPLQGRLRQVVRFCEMNGEVVVGDYHIEVLP
ncbi:MAG: DUF503 domain-containing protein [Magnetococcales bacterium]|nr:DUF503 domain-containing protein [Magnetococcales bacterium]